MFRELRTSSLLFLLLFVITGFAYPLLTLTAGQHLFKQQANGSLIWDGDRVIGSSLIGQNFTSNTYFHGRPSAAGNGYDAANSSGSNLATTSADLLKAVTDRATDLHTNNAAPIPVDLVTTSASGLDPDISIDAAKFQAARVAMERHLSVEEINKLIDRLTISRSLGFIGENRVNVLELNRALDQIPAQ